MTLERGAFLHNRYRILEILGQAVDDNLGVEVAVKENLFTTEEYARQFRREAIILANLRHPNLPRVSDHFVIEGQGQYLIMDYIEGEDLRDRMDRTGILPESEVLIIGIAICEALAYMHTRKPPVLHRDIKPGNVRITNQGHLFLVDFGLAKVVQAGQATTTGARAMTPGYSPPEQYGAARTDHRSDIYSLGATLYAALSGVIPEDSLARTMEQIELTPIRKRNPDVSKRMANTIERALEVHPDDRFQTAEDFKVALLNCRGISQRKISEDGILISPPPGDQGELVESELLIPLDEADESPIARVATPRPSSKPVHATGELPIRKSRSERRKNALLIAMIILAIAVIGGGVAYSIDPTLASRIGTAVAPAVGWMAPTDTLTPTEEPAVVALTITPTPSKTQPVPSDTKQALIVPTATATKLPTQTPTVTLTPSPIASPTPQATPLGGGQGQIAFVSDRSGIPQIWLINSDGSELHQVTESQQGACQPDWSPDGERLVFISPCKGNQEDYRSSSLFIINADGTNLTPLATVGGGDYDPAWSPDGKTIAFTSLRGSDWPQIYLYHLESGEIFRLSEEEKRDKQPTWSPDGSLIAFVSTRKGPYQIWTMGVDGSNQELFSRSGGKKNTYPDWSPDGLVILFTQSEGEGSLVHLSGAQYPDGALNEFRIQPVQGLPPMREADYSPDGYWLAFESWPEGDNHDVYIMAPMGAEFTPLTTDPAWDFDPVWRPMSP
jgi:serine/threonine protein kinase